MGLALGLLTGLAGFVQQTPALMRRALALSLIFICAFTLAAAMIGLAYGYFQTRSFDLGAYADWFIPGHLEQPRRFLCAGYMHNAAYIGGALSIPATWLFHFAFRSLHRRDLTARPAQ